MLHCTDSKNTLCFFVEIMLHCTDSKNTLCFFVEIILRIISYYIKKEMVNKGFLSSIKNCFTFWSKYAKIIKYAKEWKLWRHSRC